MIASGALYMLSFLFFINSFFYFFRYDKLVNYFSGLALLMVSAASSLAALHISGHIVHVPIYYGSYPVWSSLLYTSFIFLVLINFSYNFTWKKKYTLFFLYPLVQVILFVWSAWLNYENLDTIIAAELEASRLSYFPYRMNHYIHLAGMFYFYIFIYTFSIYNFDINKVEKEKRKKAIISFTAFLISTTYLLVISTVFIINRQATKTIGAAEGVLTYAALFLFSVFYQFWPYYYKAGYTKFDLKTFSIEKYTRSYLESNQLEMATRNLKKLVEEEKFYKDEDVNLNKLALSLGLTVHQTSEYLNRHLNMGFFHYINYLRVEEAKRLLSDPDNKLTIIEICYEVGYNTPSVFYKAFKSITGGSPKAWQDSFFQI